MIALLVNPAAGRGRASRRAPHVERALSALDTVQRFDTVSPGDERRQARLACEAGARVLAVLGGDGALHHAMRGLLDVGAPVPLAPFAAGTGNDFVKALDLPANDDAVMAARIAAGRTRHIDIGLVDDVPFLNAAGFGFDVEVLERMQRRSWLRGTAAYVSTALQALFGYRGFAVAHDVAPDHAHGGIHGGMHGGTPRFTPRHQTLMFVCANGPCFGGAFRIAPGALLDDGRLDLVRIAHLGPFARPRLFLRAVRGTHVHDPAVTHWQGTSATLHFDAAPRFEADGELYLAATSRVVVSVRPGALAVVA